MGTLEQAVSVQTPILEFMTATSLPIKIVNELFSNYANPETAQKQDTSKKRKKENKTPSDLSLNIMNKTIDKSSKLCKSFVSFWNKPFIKTTLFISAAERGPGRCPNDSKCGLILLYFLAYLIVLRRKSLLKLCLNFIQKSIKTRYLFSRVFSLQEIWE